MRTQPQQIADLLLARRGHPTAHPSLADLTPQLALETIAELKKRVDAEKLRSAGRALQIAEVARTLAAACVDPSATALACWARGNALYHLSRYPEARACYQQAEAIYAAQGQALQVAGMQLNQVAVLQDMGEFPAALALAEQARAVCREVGPPAQRYLASLEMNVGATYQQMGDLAAALAAYERARAIFTREHEAVEMARLDINRANVLQEMGRFDAAEELYRSARAILVEPGYDQEVARTDYNLGVLAYRRGQYQAALRHLEAAHSGFAAVPNPTEVAMVDLFRSFVYRDLNLLQETIMLAESAERTFKREHTPWLRAMALINQGIGYQRLGAYAVAEQRLAHARRVLRRHGALNRVVALDVDRAALALAAGRVATARRLARRVARQIDPGTLPALAARTQILLARCNLSGNHPDPHAARSLAEAACSVAERYDLPEQAAARHVLGQALERAGAIQAAWQQYQAALRAVEQVRARLPLDDARMGFMDDKLPMYADAVRLSLRVAPPAQVFALLNLAQSAPIARLEPWFSAAATAAPADADLRTRLQSLRELWHWHQSKLEAMVNMQADGDAQAAPATAETLRRLEIEIADLVRRRQVRALDDGPRVRGDAHGQGEVFLGAIQERLQPRDLLLHYFVSDEKLGAVLVTRSNVHLVPDLAPATALLRVLRSWRFQLEHGRADAANHSAGAHLSRLYQALVAPLEHLLDDAARLFLVIPPGWHDVPFAALHDGQSYLIERFQLAHLSAPEVLLHSSAVRAPRDRALIVGYSEQGRLPQTIGEAQQVADALQPVIRTTCLLEEEATLDRLGAGIRASHLLHVATHAVFRPDNPLFSWVRLADARLTVADLYEMTLPQRPLVVLSACETGRGQPRGGGLLGMGRGFLAAGAAGLIVSLWKIEDQSSARVMVDMYTHLTASRDRADPPAALCHAQRAAVRCAAHPFDWAGFIFIQG